MEVAMCGIFGVWGSPCAARNTALGLHLLQHRARQYAGAVTTDGQNPYRQTGRGIVQQVLTPAVLEYLHGHGALGHIRYATVADNPGRDNSQPILAPCNGGWLAVAHNGNLTNVEALKRTTLRGILFSTSMDTECIIHLLRRARSRDMFFGLEEALAYVRGSYSLGILLRDRLIGVRDPSGNRPLSIGRRDKALFLSSETCAFDAVRAQHVRDVEPGEIVSLSESGVESFEMRDLPVTPRTFCRFEDIYFAHPASVINGVDVTDFRMRLGMRLEELFPVPNAHIVVPIPDSSNAIGLGFAASGRSGHLCPAISRSHFVGRTFIAPSQELREAYAVQKYVVSHAQVNSRVVVLIDDSIVRLTTLPGLVRRIKFEAGAKEIHVRIGCPPIAHPCIYGIDTPTHEELAAARMSVQEIREKSGADSLEYFPLEALRGLASNSADYCYACMTGHYPLPT